MSPADERDASDRAATDGHGPRSTVHEGGRTDRCAHCEFPLHSDESSDGELEFCCYGCYLAHQITGETGQTGQFNLLVARLLIGVFFSMLVMVFSLPLYSDAIYSAPTGEHALGPLASVFRWISFGAVIPVLLLLGLPVARNALRAGWRASVDVLILTGVLAAFAVSTIHLVRGGGETYFETTAMLLVLLTAGRTLEAAGKSRAAGAFRELLELSPPTVRVIDGGDEERIEPTDSIERGDRIRVLAGERFPADGVVLEGRASVDRSLLTGESEPEFCEPGGRVHAGTLNLDGSIELRAEHVSGERLLDRVVSLLEEARGLRGRFDRMADRLARAFLPVAVAVALGTFFFWVGREGSVDAFLHALATLLIACPCALGIAAPLAIWTGIRQAARAGVLVRSGDVLEALARGGQMFFDKTGTLTPGDQDVAAVVPQPGVSEEEVLRIAAGLGKHSLHPASRALAAEAKGRGVPAAAVRDVSSEPGLGVRGETEEGEALLGRRDFVLSAIGAGVGGEHEEASIHVAHGGRLLGTVRVEESVRPEIAEVVLRLRALGFDCAILTGDASERGERIGEALGIPASSGLLPAAKVVRLERAREFLGSHRIVAMVGDGLNDAPVLAAADVGIAVGGEVELVRDVAGAVLLGSPGSLLLEGLPRLVEISRRTVWRLRLYLLWAVGYNAVGMAFAAAGFVHPLLAAVLMVLSSLFVIAAAVER